MLEFDLEYVCTKLNKQTEFGHVCSNLNIYTEFGTRVFEIEDLYGIRDEFSIKLEIFSIWNMCAEN